MKTIILEHLTKLMECPDNTISKKIELERCIRDVGGYSDELVEMNNLHSEELEKQMIDILNKELEEEYPDRTFPKLLIKKLKDEENDLSKNHRK
jgi:hypothetical protein